jgi:hypothetical protein
MKNKRRNLWMSATLMCSFFIVAFKFGSEGINWFWTGQEIVPVILGISAIIFGLLWFLEATKKN